MIKNDYIWGVIWLAIIIFIFFLPVIFNKQTLFVMSSPYISDYDFHRLQTSWQLDGGTHGNQEVPDTIAAVRMLRSGILPLWTNYVGAGQPLAANMVSGMYNPLRALFFYLFFSWKAFDWFILLELFIAGIGMFLYLKALGLSRHGSLFGAIAFMFSGFFMIFLTFWMLAIYAFVPYALHAAEWLVKKPCLRSAAWYGLTGSLLILGSHPAITAVALLFVSVYFLARVCFYESARMLWKRYLGYFLLAQVIVLALSAPFLFDFGTLLLNGASFYFVEARVELSKFPLIYFLHFIVPPSMSFEFANSGGLYKDFSLAIPYIGVSVFLFFFWHWFVKNKHAASYFFYGFLIFIFLKIFGIQPFYWLWQSSVLRDVNIAKLYGLIAVAASVLGAMGYDAWARNASVSWRKFVVGLLTILSMFALVFLFAHDTFIQSYVPNFTSFSDKMVYAKNLPFFIQEALLTLLTNGWIITLVLFLWVFIIGAVIVYLIRKYVVLRSRWIPLLVLVLLVIELWIYMPKLRDGLFHPIIPYTPVPEYILFLQNKAQESQFRIIGTGGVLASHIGNFVQLQDFRSLSAAYVKRYLVFAQGNSHSYLFHITPQKLEEVPDSFLDAANIRFIISKTPLQTERYSLVYDKEVKIYEYRTLPRAFMAFEGIIVSNMNEAVAKLEQPQFNARRSIIIEQAISDVFSSGAIDEDSAQIVEYTPQRVIVNVKSEKKGILVLSDTFYPGWRAFIDGKETKIYPVNVMFQGIEVSSGNHVVKWVYQPRWLWPGFILAAAAFITCISALLLRNRVSVRVPTLFLGNKFK